MLALLAIGLAHALLVWSGDILTTYALVALLLLLFFRDTPQSRLPKWGIAFMLLPIVLMLTSGLMVEAAGTDARGRRRQMAAMELEADATMVGSSSRRSARRRGRAATREAVAQRWQRLRR